MFISHYSNILYHNKLFYLLEGILLSFEYLERCCEPTVARSWRDSRHSDFYILNTIL